MTIPASRIRQPGLRPPSAWLTPRRIRAHAIVLALCLWGVCAVDFRDARPVRPRRQYQISGFPPVSDLGALIAQGRAGELYDEQVLAERMHAIVGRDTTRAPAVFLRTASRACCLSRWADSPFSPQAANLGHAHAADVFRLHLSGLEIVPRSAPVSAACRSLCAIAFPPLFHFFVRGQISALVLACFTAAFLAFRAVVDWLAGIALGFLVFKPQFLVAIPSCCSWLRRGKSSPDSRSPRAHSWPSPVLLLSVPP